MFGYYGSYILVIPAFIFALIAQQMVQGSFRRYSKFANRRGYTGADVATAILRRNGINHVAVEPVRGNLTDHYDPRTKTVRLSEGVYGSKSLAALSIAAHECGHAIQDEESYFFLRLRHSILPAVNIASNTATPLAFMGIFLGALSNVNSIGYLILQLAIIMFTVVVVFHVVTLPVELNASARAIRILENDGYLDQEEIIPARRVLRAAAMTYVAAAAVALSNLIRFVILSRSRD